MALILTPPACRAPGEPSAVARHSSPLRLRSPAPRRRPSSRPTCRSSTVQQHEAAAGSSDKPSSSGGGEQQRRRFTFAERCQQLACFREQYGHTRVPVQEPTGLGAWVGAKRHAWKAGQLPPSQQQQLATLGFCVDAYDDAWVARFRQLAAFHSEHGHCRVPPPPAAPAAPAAGDAITGGQQQPGCGTGVATQAQEQYPGLHAWLQQQRHRWRQGTLPDERRRRLEGLGLRFNAAHEAAWDQRFAELLAFKEEHGHADVPARWPPNPALAAWVEAQRRRWRGTQGAPLTTSQHSRLISCGFQFELQQRGDEAWDSRYAQLLQLQQQRGNSLGNQPLPAAGGLRQWATAQRQLWRQGMLAPERASRLAALGLLRGARERWLDRLQELDGLVACLGLPAMHALLTLAPSPKAAAAMAEAAVRAACGGSSEGQEGSSSEAQEGSSSWHTDSHHTAGSSSSGGSWDGGEPTACVLEDSAGPQQLDAHEAAAAAGWWFGHLRSTAAVPVKTVRALQERGFECLLLAEDNG